ncbi:MAG: UDP-N-acetylmuramate dehydrogenase [Planctomycetota bacterium]|jgi:UDP-N-acetylmuramate dehydrogenase
MDLPAVLHERLAVRESADLGPLTTLGVGGRAPWVLEPRSVEELALAVGALGEAGLPFRMLGHGSNLLVSDAGVEEVVVHTRRMTGLVVDGGPQGIRVRALAGCSLMRLVAFCARRGLSGVEPLIGIPGTVGGAVAGNAGSRHGAIGEHLAAVRTLLPDGSLEETPCRPEHFGYRRSPFRGQVIVEALLELQPSTRRDVEQRTAAILADKRASQPLTARSSGCIFRNGTEPSGHLIEATGCKGLREGSARVSDRHANFIVNEGGATASDVLALVRRVQDAVRARTGHELELEVEVWGQSGPAAGGR